MQLDGFIAGHTTRSGAVQLALKSLASTDLHKNTGDRSAVCYARVHKLEKKIHQVRAFYNR